MNVFYRPAFEYAAKPAKEKRESEKKEKKHSKKKSEKDKQGNKKGEKRKEKVIHAEGDNGESALPADKEKEGKGDGKTKKVKKEKKEKKKSKEKEGKCGFVKLGEVATRNDSLGVKFTRKCFDCLEKRQNLERNGVLF